MKKWIVTLLSLPILLVGGIYFEELSWSMRYLTTDDDRSPAPPPNIPPCPSCNLLLISMDTLRADQLGFLNKTAKNSPTLDQIASQSIVFREAFTNAYFTTPAHMSVFTSLYPLRHQVDNAKFRIFSFNKDRSFSQESVNRENILDPNYQTLAETLKSRGYKTHWNASLRSAFLNLEHGFARGFESFRESPFVRGVELDFVSRKEFDLESLRPLLGKNSSPQFVFLHSWVTHLPYHLREQNEETIKTPVPLTPRRLSLFSRALIQRPALLLDQLANKPLNYNQQQTLIAKCTNVSDLRPCFEKYVDLDMYWHAVGQWQHRKAHRALTNLPERRRLTVDPLIQAYQEGVRDLDRQVQTIWRALEQSGQLKNTLVVFISDHGEEFFEHGTGSHLNFYENILRIPFFIYHPRLQAQIEVNNMVSLVDVMPTILKILQVPAPPQIQGGIGWEKADDYIFGSTLGADFVRDRSWKLMRDSYGFEELYFLPLDPEEKNNLIEFGSPWVKAAYRRLAQAREDWAFQQTLDD